MPPANTAANALQADCSHLVQEVYARAGLGYDLASSSELYQARNASRGTNAAARRFNRLAGPRWSSGRPRERTFYSSVRTGLKTESYDSSYWRRRGRPRFCRYRFDGHKNSAVMPASPAAHPLTSLVITDPAEDEPTTVTRAEGVGLASENPHTVAPVRSLLQDTILISEGREPTRQAIAQALIAYADGAAVQAAALPDSFIIFERLRVDGLKLEGKHARARLELHTAASVAGESVNLRDKRIKMPLDLQRTSQGWLLRKPQPVYFSRRAGVRALAERLAELTRKDSDPRQQARLAMVLDDLLNR